MSTQSTVIPVYFLLSVAVFLFISFFMSEEKYRISWKSVLSCMIWQVLFAFCVFKISSIANVFAAINDVLGAINESTAKAVAVCFGGLASPPPEAGFGFILAFQGLPSLIVISALSALLIHWKILPFIVKIMSAFFRKIFFISGTLGIAVSANIFTGMSETPLVVRPYLARLSRSELFSMMCCGTAGTASSVMVLYSILIGQLIPNSISHIISAALINIPGALALSRIMIPETSEHHTDGDYANFTKAKNSIDAAFTGIIDGGKVIITVIAMIIGFVALIDVSNKVLALLPYFNQEPLSLQRILGWICFPLSLLMGVPFEEAGTVGALIGTKIITNELIGFQEFAKIGLALSDHTRIITLYALCSFANIGSMGIMTGVYGTLVPERKGEVVQLGIRALLVGVFANCLTASLAGFFITP